LLDTKTLLELQIQMELLKKNMYIFCTKFLICFKGNSICVDIWKCKSFSIYFKDSKIIFSRMHTH